MEMASTDARSWSALAPKNLRDHALQPEYLAVTQSPDHREDALQGFLPVAEGAIGERRPSEEDGSRYRQHTTQCLDGVDRGCRLAAF